MSSAAHGEVILNSIDDRRKKACVQYFKNLKPEKCKDFVSNRIWETDGKQESLEKLNFHLSKWEDNRQSLTGYSNSLDLGVLSRDEEVVARVTETEKS